MEVRKSILYLGEFLQNLKDLYNLDTYEYKELNDLIKDDIEYILKKRRLTRK